MPSACRGGLSARPDRLSAPFFDTGFDRVAVRHTIIMVSRVDKRFFHDGTTHETPHMTACEFLPERIQDDMR